jgi:phage portal protein BeeE
MIGTSRMFDKIAGGNFGKQLRGKLRNSAYMNMGQNDASSAQADTLDYDVSRDFMTNCYEVNEWCRAIIDLTVERTSQVELFPMPLALREDDGEPSDETKKHMEHVSKILLKPNKDGESFHDLRKKVMHDTLVYDEAGMQIVKADKYAAEDGDISLWCNVSGEELFVNANEDGTLKDSETYAQIRNARVVSYFSKDEFMNFIKNRRAGYSNGFSPISSIALSILGDFEMVNYNYKFFENNAKPNIAFLFEQLGFGKGQGALERAKAWYKREHQGNPHLPLFMGAEKGNVKIMEMKTTHKDMEFTNWDLLLLSRMMAVFGMQPMVLGVLTDTTGKLNSEVQTEQFKRNAIVPLIKMFLHTFNAVLIWGDNNLNYDDIYLTPSNLDIDDEEKQAKIDEIYLDRGVITINQLRAKLQMSPVSWGNEPFVPLNYAPLSVLQEYQQSRIIGAANKPPAPKDNGEGDEGDEGNNGKIVYADRVDMQLVHIMKNFKTPTGLEKTAPSKIIEVATQLIRERDKALNKTYSFPYASNDIFGTIKRYGLRTKKVLSNK